MRRPSAQTSKTFFKQGVDGRHHGSHRELWTGAEAGVLGDDGRHLDQVEVVDPCFAQGVIEGRERSQAFRAPLGEVEQAGYV